jgi:hypothetical protein
VACPLSEPGRGSWFLLLMVLCACRPAKPSFPVVALITIDTWRADHFDAQHTPNLWDLAEGGEIFENAWTPIGLTSPAHATMLTGMQPWEHGMEANNHHGYRLSDTVPNLPSRFPGFSSAAFVSAYPAGPDGGLASGWDTFDGPKEGERPGGVAVEKARQWLIGQQGPALVWVHLYEPHGPYEGSASDDVGRYAQEVALADALLEPLIEDLVSQKARIVLAADHGEVLLEERCGRQHERSIADVVLHVPLMRWENGRPPSREPGLISLAEVPRLLLGEQPHFQQIMLGESGTCEPDCAPGCSPTGLSGRDRVGRDVGGKEVFRPGVGWLREGRPGPTVREQVSQLPPMVPPPDVPDEAALEALGYRPSGAVKP